MDAERQRLHDELRDELFRCQLSNSQILDKSILSLSSAGLGFSLVFIKNVVSPDKVSHLWLLYCSWGVFILAIVCTLVSFLTSQCGIKKQLDINKEYYLEDNEKALDQTNLPAQITTILSYVSVILYITAVSLTVGFIALNIKLGTTYIPHF